MISAASTLLLDGGSCCGPMGGWGWLGMTAGWLTMVGVIALVVWAVRRPPTAPTREASALEILAARYAGGEISEEDYEKRRSVLLGSGPSSKPSHREVDA